jgi:hypothetical protein
MKYADIIIPHGATNTKAINFVVDNLRLRLRQMGIISQSPLKGSNESIVNFEPINTTYKLSSHIINVHTYEDGVEFKKFEEILEKLLLKADSDLNE